MSGLAVTVRSWTGDLRGTIGALASRPDGPLAIRGLALAPAAWGATPQSEAPANAPDSRWKRLPAVLKICVLTTVFLLPAGWFFVSSENGVHEDAAVRSDSAGRSGPFAAMQARFAQRAGIALEDDFRTGLHDWQGGESWADSWKFDQAGFVQPGQLALYTPTLAMRDYELEFVGQIEKKSLGWVVRAADLKNYMAIKLVQVKGGPLPQVALVRYAVINGKEEKGSNVTIPMEVRTDTMYRVRMEVEGNHFSLFVQDRMVDNWDDSRLPAGGVGFFSGKGEAGRLRRVQVTYQNDWVGRICAALAG
jgi:hypothetical protein